MMSGVEDRRLGRLIRAARIRKGWWQLDVELAAGIDQTTQSLIERGHLGGLTVAVIRRSAQAVDVVVELEPRGGAHHLVRLLDEGHAALVEHLVALLRRCGWTVLAEYTFNHYGDRGSVDIVAWHPQTQALLIVEVKTRIADVQGLLTSFDRKLRIVPGLLRRERGWEARTVGRLLLVDGGSTQRRAVTSHAETFASVLPQGSRDARRWIAQPSGSLAAVWFVSPTTVSRGNHVSATSRRVRQRPSRSEAGERGPDSVISERDSPATTTTSRT